MRGLTTAILASVAFSLAACGTPGAQFAGPPPSDKAKVAVERSSDLLYVGVGARIDVNGVRVADLGRGDTFSAVFPPGELTVSADAWSYPGRFSVTVKTEPGKEYVFEVSPRGESYVAGMFGAAGMAVDYSVNESGGAFQIRLKSVVPKR